MVGAGPHIGEDQGPKVNNRQTVGVHRALGLFGDEVIHHSQKTRCEEKAHCVMSVPPLHHGVLHTCIR